MIDHIIREAIPALRDFVDVPTPANFQAAMLAFRGALDEEQKHTGSHSAWESLQHSGVQPTITRNSMKAWCSGKPPDDPVKLVTGLLNYLKGQGIDHKPTGKKPPTASQVFGTPMTSVAAAAAARALDHSPFNPPATQEPGAPAPTGPQPVALQERMAAIQYADLWDGALRWQPDPGMPAMRLAAYLNACRNRLPPEATERVMMPLGVGSHYFQRWCLAAEGQHLPDTQWPDAMFQGRMMRQYLAFFTLVELALPAATPEHLAYRFFSSLALLSQDDVARSCLVIQGRAPVQNAWAGLTPEVLRAWAGGAAPIPRDQPLLDAIQSTLSDAIYVRFREGLW